MEDRETYASFRCHYGWWSDYRFTVETDYCWSSKLSTWDTSGDYTEDDAGTDEFLEWYEETRAADSRDNAEEGPTIEIVIGDIVVHAFDMTRDKSHADYRECVGFYAVREKERGASIKPLYAKFLTFYACDDRSFTMSEEKFVNLLSGFSIEDEFDALIED